jgi:hypothetical protein
MSFEVHGDIQAALEARFKENEHAIETLSVCAKGAVLAVTTGSKRFAPLENFPVHREPARRDIVYHGAIARISL